MRYSHHFPINVEPDKPIRFRDYRQAHKYDMESLISDLKPCLPLVHKVVHPCHVSIGIHIDQDNIFVDLLTHKLWQAFAHYVLQIADTLDQAQPIVFLHKQYKTNLYALYG